VSVPTPEKRNCHIPSVLLSQITNHLLKFRIWLQQTVQNTVHYSDQNLQTHYLFTLSSVHCLFSGLI